MIARYLLALPGLCALASLSACRSMPPPIDTAQIAPLHDAYPLAAGDRVRITVFGEQNLTGEYNIAAQGTIAFPLVGSIPAKGRTTDDVSESIRAKLADGYVLDPQVSTEVLTFRPYYILGEVNKPGEYPFANGLTLEQAIAAAGGFTYRANRGRIFLRRRESEARTVRLGSAPVQVLPGDTIRVGERYF